MLVKTEEGLEIEVIDNAFNNIETLDALADLSADDPFAITRLSNILFSKEEKKKLYDFYRDENGVISIERYSKVLVDIMSKLGNKEKN